MAYRWIQFCYDDDHTNSDFCFHYGTYDVLYGYYVYDYKKGGAPDMGEFNIMFAFVMVVSLLFSFVLQNLVIINNGMIYYTMQNGESGTAVNSEIDLIGAESED